MLEGIAAKTYGIAEQLAVRCVLSVDAPEQNKAHDRGAKGDEDRKKRKITAHQAIVDERALLESLGAEAQGMCDVIGTKFVKACGWQWAVESESLGGGLYLLKCMQTQVDGVTPDIEDGAEEATQIELRARRFMRTEYQEFRRRLITGERGEADEGVDVQPAGRH